LKIPKGLSEAVRWKRTDNTLAKKKKDEKQPLIYKTLHSKLKIEQHEPHKKMEMNSGAPGRVSRSSSSSGTHRVTLIKNLLVNHEWGNVWNKILISNCNL
jgi:hypothetical protein